ncbi:MAG: NAD(+)/NADH kinase [Bacillota bacterium]
MNNISCIGLVLNTNKKKAYVIAQKVISWCQNKNIEILMEEKAASRMNKEKLKATYQEMKDKAEMVILFGGDGTFLYTSRHFIGIEIPILGINLGKLGFLTEIETEELEKTLKRIYRRDYTIEKRMLLKTNVRRQEELIYDNFALNDIVVNRGGNAKMVKIQLYINDEFVNSYRADGLILATPTGSTAYNLSAGGPIVNPQIRAIIVTPICPHTLYVRPMVISEREEVKIIISGDSDGMKITADGRDTHNLQDKDQIIIKASRKSISMVKFSEKTFYNILHEKMRSGMV